MKKIEVDESFLSLDCFRSSHSLRIVIYFKKYIKCAQIHLTFDIPYKDQMFKILVIYHVQLSTFHLDFKYIQFVAAL